MMDLKSYFTHIHKEGYFFVCIFAILAAGGGMLWGPLGWIFLFLAIWCIYFFRDPERIIPKGKDLVVSPADGLIQKIAEVEAPKELGVKSEKRTRVSIFLSVMDVHVNRIPISGEIQTISYRPGKFFNASFEKSSEFNEKNYLVVKLESGKNIVVSQIAGLIARRIVCSAKEKDSVDTGQRFGIIRFGSRVDIYLPTGEVPMVTVGQTVVGGETIISQLGNKHKVSEIKK